MGAGVEGWSWQDIDAKFGILEDFKTYKHYDTGWERLPGTTEDGIERQKFMITAIMEKKDRVTAEDVRAMWLRDMKDTAAGTVSEPFEGILLAMARSGIPANELGRYCDYAGLNSFSRSCHPIGLINAGDPVKAMEDVNEVGQLYQTTNSRGLKWACVTGVAVAAAARPDATVDSVIGKICDLCDRDMVVREIENGLKLTKDCKDIGELRKVFDTVYGGVGVPYSMSFANEVVTKAICIFSMTKGNTYDSIIAGVNVGRDTDCIAAVAAGISGALTGASSVPQRLINQLEEATKEHKYTNNKRTMKECADGLYDAYMARLARMKQHAEMMGVTLEDAIQTAVRAL